MKYIILTPTTGHPKLQELLVSINRQECDPDVQIEHVIVVDGPAFREKTDSILSLQPPHPNMNRHLLYLPFNTGANGFLGHRIYAGVSQLLDGDYFIFVDEDNSFQSDHIQAFHTALKHKKYDWLFCLRRIYNDEGFICDDNCESLGHLHPVFYNLNDHLIDTSCYCLSRKVAIAQAHIWNLPSTNDHRNPDRQFAKVLMNQYPNFVCTSKHTLNYYVGNRPTSPKAELFLKGNQFIQQKFGEIPWSKPKLYVVHFDKQLTERIIARIYSNEKPCIAYSQWNLNLLDAISPQFHVLDAYRSYIPSDSTLIVHMCNPNELPSHILQRNDLRKILFTIESPNIRHKAQWDLKFLCSYFTDVITYWQFLLYQREPHIHFFPLNNPRLSFANLNDLNCIHLNKSTSKQVCMVLEKRSQNAFYYINGVKLHALDYLREEYAHALGKRIDCYGASWETDSIVNYKASKNRFLDEEKVIDILGKYTFCLIIENCDASGYVSEKIYDAFIVGSIPLYYGNPNSQVNIPEDCYVNLRNIPPAEIAAYLEKLDTKDIERIRANIYSKRIALLKHTSIDAYCNKLVQICKCE